MGIGSWVGGLFHLITHAFFKALLFLGAGNVIHAAHHEQELTEFGGLWRKIPYTAITFGVAVLAIAGVGITVGDTMIGFAGYYSKDLILHHAGSYAWLATKTGGHPAYWLFFILPTIVAYLTAFYMTRCWMLTFAGKPRNQRLYEHARETPVMYIPLAVLAVLSVIGGTALGARPMIESAAKETNNYFDPHLRPPPVATAANPTAPVPQPARFAGFSTAWQNAGAYAQAQVADTPSIGADAYHFGEHSLRFVSSAFVFGIGLAVLIYSKGLAIPNALLRFPPLRWLKVWLYRAMYFDELYAGIIVAFTMALATVISVIDRYVIDAIVNLTARVVRRGSVLAELSDRYVFDRAVSATTEMVQEIGVAVRAPQTGRIRTYVTALMVALALCLAGAIIVVLSTTGR
jgi:NADH-quinone oxidoreductase subunit L